MNENHANEYVNIISKQSREFCIIGLTGKIRSGTSDVCKLLTSWDFCDYVTQPANTDGYSMSEIREYKVMYRYLHHNWKPFVELSVTSVILSFLLDATSTEIEADSSEKAIISVVEEYLKNSSNVLKKEALANAENVINIIKYKKGNSADFVIDDSWWGWGELNSVSMLQSAWREVRQKLVSQQDYCKNTFVFCYGILPVLEQVVRSRLKEENKFTKAFQDIGNNVRATGKAVYRKGADKPTADHLFDLPERINQIIKMLRHFDQFAGAGTETERETPILIVINNFKNYFEADYFKRRYSSFYLLSVSCDEKMRQAKFTDINQCRLADLKENLSSGKRLYKKAQKIVERYGKEKLSEEFRGAEWSFLQEIMESKSIRKQSYELNLSTFILQDIMACIENADIFVTRNYQETDYKCDYSLIRLLGRIVTLILHPGILTPTKLERCMQIAMTAKLNSGCLSRQVGAVVTDNEYNILSLGWNDAPCGVESCIRRNLYDLLRKHDPEAYSSFELSDPEFRLYLDEIKEKFNDSKQNLRGLPLAFCFKDIYQDIIKQRDQIYTRALHGEERALASCGNDRAKGGYLFTTSSPCELCAKKAKEANISKIYYIEQYPGISHTHIIEAGDKDLRARYEFFVGAVGLAYVKLYTPLMPYKDELAAQNFSPVDVHDQFLQEKMNSSNDKKTTTLSDPTQSISHNDIQPDQDQQE